MFLQGIQAAIIFEFNIINCKTRESFFIIEAGQNKVTI